MFDRIRLRKWVIIGEINEELKCIARPRIHNNSSLPNFKVFFRFKRIMRIFAFQSDSGFYYESLKLISTNK